MTLILLSLAWLAGLYLGQAAAAGAGRDAIAEFAWLLPCLAVVACAAAWLGRDDHRLRLVGMGLVLGILAIWRVFATLPSQDPLAGTEGPVVLHGVISSSVEVRDSAVLFDLRVQGMEGEGGSEQLDSRVLVRTDRYGDWRYGDRVVARGELRSTEGSPSYWRSQLARRGITTTMEYPRIYPRGGPSGWDPLGWISRLRVRLEQVCGRLLPEPQASLLGGILVGARATTPPEFREALNVTSTSHIVAVSGFNVTLVAGMAQAVALRFLSRRRATLFAMALVWLYALLTGIPPSAVRAAVMSTMVLGAILAGRGGDTLSFLCFSGAAMAGVEPMILDDLGFQLSFLATAGLVLLEPVIRVPLGKLPGWLSSTLSVTLAAQLATLPILVDSFHTLSLVSPLTNLLVVPALPGLMVVGGLAVLLGALFEPLVGVVAPLAWAYLTYVVEVIRWTAQLPSASVVVGSLGVASSLLYWLVLLAIALWPLPEFRDARAALVALAGGLPRWAVAGGVAAAISLAAIGVSARPDGRVHVWFLDVGGGHATLVQGAEGHRVLVDGGASPSAITSALGPRVELWGPRLDAVVVTDFGEDHLAGLLEAVRRYPVGMVLQPALPPGELKGAAGAWRDWAREGQPNLVEARLGQRIALGPESRLEVVYLAPTSGAPKMALELVVGKVRMLLPGDISLDGQQQLATRGASRLDILLVPGHGAAGALNERFAQMASPQLALIPAKADDSKGEPSPATLALLRNSTVLRTDLHGTIEVVIDPSGYEVFTEK